MAQMLGLVDNILFDTELNYDFVDLLSKKYKLSNDIQNCIYEYLGNYKRQEYYDNLLQEGKRLRDGNRSNLYRELRNRLNSNEITGNNYMEYYNKTKNLLDVDDDIKKRSNSFVINQIFYWIKLDFLATLYHKIKLLNLNFLDDMLEENCAKLIREFFEPSVWADNKSIVKKPLNHELHKLGDMWDFDIRYYDRYDGLITSKYMFDIKYFKKSHDHLISKYMYIERYSSTKFMNLNGRFIRQISKYSSDIRINLNILVQNYYLNFLIDFKSSCLGILGKPDIRKSQEWQYSQKYCTADQFYIFINFEEVKDNLVEKIRNEFKCTCSQNCKNNSNYHKCGCKCHKKNITKKVSKKDRIKNNKIKKNCRCLFRCSCFE